MQCATPRSFIFIITKPHGLLYTMNVLVFISYGHSIPYLQAKLDTSTTKVKC